jgi:hypothetical protein
MWWIPRCQAARPPTRPQCTTETRATWAEGYWRVGILIAHCCFASCDCAALQGAADWAQPCRPGSTCSVASAGHKLPGGAEEVSCLLSVFGSTWLSGTCDVGPTTARRKQIVRDTHPRHQHHHHHLSRLQEGGAQGQAARVSCHHQVHGQGPAGWWCHARHLRVELVPHTAPAAACELRTPRYPDTQHYVPACPPPPPRVTPVFRFSRTASTRCQRRRARPTSSHARCAVAVSTHTRVVAFAARCHGPDRLA